MAHEDLINGILDSLYSAVLQVILYGSGGATTDVAVITTHKLGTDEEARLSNAVYELNRKRKCGYSLIDIDKASFDKWENCIPLYRRIKREGTVIWQYNE